MLFGTRSDSDTEVLYLLENSTALVNHHNADGTSPVSLLTWEHDAKLQNLIEHSVSNVQKILYCQKKLFPKFS